MMANQCRSSLCNAALLSSFLQDLDSSETGTVRRRAKTIVTPKMAMESFRLSFLNDGESALSTSDSQIPELPSRPRWPWLSRRHLLRRRVHLSIPYHAGEPSSPLRVRLFKSSAMSSLRLCTSRSTTRNG